MKTASQAMEYEKTPVAKKVRTAVAVKEVERTIDHFGFGRICWYLVKRYKLQISVLVNAYFIGAPLVHYGISFYNTVIR